MKKFIYVFSKESKDRLLKSGYKLLKSDDRNSLYIFKAFDEPTFALNDLDEYMESDSLTF